MALRETIGAPLSAGAREELQRFLASLEEGGGRDAVQAALRARGLARAELLGPAEIDETIEICHGSPEDEDEYLFFCEAGMPCSRFTITNDLDDLFQYPF